MVIGPSPTFSASTGWRACHDDIRGSLVSGAQLGDWMIAEFLKGCNLILVAPNVRVGFIDTNVFHGWDKVPQRY